MKVSFDYDGTLELKEVQEYALQLLRESHELWIVTMRHEQRQQGNQDLFDVAESLGIPTDQVIFTNGGLKYHFFEENEGFAFHLDDCKWQIDHIVDSKCTVGVFFEVDNEWESECKSVLG